MRRLPRISRRRVLAIVLGAALLMPASVLFAFPDRDGVTRAAVQIKLSKIDVSLPARTGGGAGVVRLPRSYFGISTEYWTLPIFARRTGMFERMLSLLEVPGDGPFVLRIGGDSADRTRWLPSFRFEPAWVFPLTPAIVRSTGEMVRDLGLRLILDLNLITGSPRLGAVWARAAEQALPPGSISGFEVGNEPDLYNRQYWMQTTELGRALPTVLNAAGYVRDFGAYRRALAAAVPGMPLIGPAVGNAVLDSGWIARLLRQSHAGLGVVSAHRYPYSACVPPTSPAFPTLGRLLSERATAGMASGIRSVARLVHRAGLRLRLTEINSVTCGGLPGVSDSFATALWAPDALFSFLRAGVDGVNVHVRANTINAPFAFTAAGRLIARPLMYGLIAFVRTLGPGAELVRLHIGNRHRVHLKAWGVRVAGGRLHILLIDKGHRPAVVDLHLPGATGVATVQRLVAPSASARSGVSLAGRHLDAAGQWVGRSSIDVVGRGTSGYRVAVPRYSAALVSVQLRPSP